MLSIRIKDELKVGVNDSTILEFYIDRWRDEDFDESFDDVEIGAPIAVIIRIASPIGISRIR